MIKVVGQYSQWVDTQGKNIMQTNALLLKAIQLCDIGAKDSEDLDTLSLEVLINNIIMHIEILSQYHQAIEALHKNFKEKNIAIPPETEKSYLINQKAVELVVEHYSTLTSFTRKLKSDLKSKVHYSEIFLSQL